MRKDIGSQEQAASVCSIEEWKNQVPVDTINLLKLSTPLKFIGKRWAASCWRDTVQVKSQKEPKSISNQYLRASKVIIKHQFQKEIALQMTKDKLFSTNRYIYFPRTRKTICYSVAYPACIHGFMYIVYIHTLKYLSYKKVIMTSCKSFQFYLNPQQICLNLLKALDTSSREVVKQANRQPQNPARVIVVSWMILNGQSPEQGKR